MNKLYNAINNIYAQEKAGNNNFKNGKRLHLVEKPEGIKYLIQILPSISPGTINDVQKWFMIIE